MTWRPASRWCGVFLLCYHCACTKSKHPRFWCSISLMLSTICVQPSQGQNLPCTVKYYVYNGQRVQTSPVSLNHLFATLIWSLVAFIILFLSSLCTTLTGIAFNSVCKWLYHYNLKRDFVSLYRPFPIYPCFLFSCSPPPKTNLQKLLWKGCN